MLLTDYYLNNIFIKNMKRISFYFQIQSLVLLAFMLAMPAWGETFTENVEDFSNVSLTKSNMGTRTSPDGVLTVIWTNASYYQTRGAILKYNTIEMAGGALSSSTARQDGAFARSK